MKIFLDTGDTEAIRGAAATGLVDGVTTNPSHIAKTQRKFNDVIEEICSIVPGPVSVEAVAETTEQLIQEAEKLASIAPNVVIKIPMTVEGLKAVPILEQQKNIRTNVTMIFSSTQSFLAMKAGASFVSIVLSRLDAVANESDIESGLVLPDVQTPFDNRGAGPVHQRLGECTKIDEEVSYEKDVPCFDDGRVILSVYQSPTSAGRCVSRISLVP
jgi:TalC/MipB family fructose-6-phosphate aldolase